MTSNIQSPSSGSKPFRKTLRLKFQVVDGKPQILSHERLEMICPPMVGERPEMGKQGGFWMELRDTSGRSLFHRVLQSPLGHSVEVHSPDGTIRRVFGTPSKENIFEVLVPDLDEAASIVLIGEDLNAARAKGQGKELKPSQELARFEIPKSAKSAQSVKTESSPHKGDKK